MIKIGEKLNSSIPSTGKAMAGRDAAYIARLAAGQTDAGADWLDVNAALMLEGEVDTLVWAVREIQCATRVKVMIDSTNLKAVEAALRADTVGRAIVNSVTPDASRLDAAVPLLKEFGADIVALAMGESGVPETAQGRLDAARRALDGLDKRGIDPSRVLVDPLVTAIASGHASAVVTLEAIALIRKEFPSVRIVCGASNVSFGLPKRKLINAAFLTAAVCAGADAAILDVLDEPLLQALAAAQAVAGKDEYCMEYIGFCRKIEK